MKVLLLSAYDAHSHRRWRRGLVAAFPDWDWTVLALPPRHFSWRVRGNSLSWAFGERHTLEQPYDVIVATSMTDLSALKGLVPSLAGIPTLVYCHENQFAYPEPPERVPRNAPKITTLYAMLAADRVLFNSEYNRTTLLDGAGALLAQMPDAVPPVSSTAWQRRVACCRCRWRRTGLDSHHRPVHPLPWCGTTAGNSTRRRSGCLPPC